MCVYIYIHMYGMYMYIYIYTLMEPEHNTTLHHS